MSIPFARANRRRMTDAEMRLWFHLRPMRSHGLAFRRQSPIGRFVVDFECRRAQLAVELDGAQHNLRDALSYDAERTRWLETQGYLVLRYANAEALQRTQEVVGEILAAARGRVQARYG